MSYSDISPIDVDGTVSSSAQGLLVGSFSAMPTASADNEGVTVQYTGATTTVAPIYTHNALYRCVNSGGVYSWQKVTSGDETAGSATHPVYMNAGVPTATTYELNAAGARGVDTAVTDGSSNLPTSDAVHDYVKDSTIAIKTSGGTAVGDFSLNQASNEDIVLPASAMQFSDRSVTFALQGSPDFADYPYRAQFAVTGITADDYAEVTFSSAQVASGYYAPFCMTVQGYVNLYANADVGTVTVPTISVGNYESNPDHSDPAWNTKLGKIETAGLRAYTHNGAEQGDMPVDTAATASTLMARDASGIGNVTAPASGAVDTSVVNANWVSQTGDSSPNNLIHKTGNETKQGTLSLTSIINGFGMGYDISVTGTYGTTTRRVELYTIDLNEVPNNTFYQLHIFNKGYNNTGWFHTDVMIICRSTPDIQLFNVAATNSELVYYMVDEDNILHIAFYAPSYATLKVYLQMCGVNSTIHTITADLPYLHMLSNAKEITDITGWTVANIKAIA